MAIKKFESPKPETLESAELEYFKQLQVDVNTAQTLVNRYINFLASKYKLVHGDDINPATGVIIRKRPEA